MRLLNKQGFIAGFCFQLVMLLILSGSVYSAQMSESESPLQHCQLEIIAAVQEELAGVENLEIEDFGGVESWLAGSGVDSQILILQVGRWNRRNGVLPVQLGLHQDGGREVRRWFKIRLKGKERVLLAQRDIQRGEPVYSSDFSSSLVDCQSLKRETVNFIPEKMVYQLTCNLKEGEPLPAKRLKPFRMIKRGELVHVVLNQSGIKVSTKGLAMGNGALQDIITVKNLSSKKYYQARVTAPGEVVVAY